MTTIHFYYAGICDIIIPERNYKQFNTRTSSIYGQ